MATNRAGVRLRPATPTHTDLGLGRTAAHASATMVTVKLTRSRRPIELAC